MLRLASEREKVPVVADQFGNPTSADDIAAALISASGSILKEGFNRFGNYHYCGPVRTNWAGFAEQIFSASKMPPFRKIWTFSEKHLQNMPTEM